MLSVEEEMRQQIAALEQRLAADEVSPQPSRCAATLQRAREAILRAKRILTRAARPSEN